MCAEGAILQLTRCGALDAAKHGVRVNAVCPGPILTDGTRRHAEAEGRSLEECTAEMVSGLIIKRCAPFDSGKNRFLRRALWGEGRSTAVCAMRGDDQVFTFTEFPGASQ